MKRNIAQTRLDNLELLIAEAGSAAKLAHMVGTSSSYLSQVRNCMPTRKGTPRGVGDDLAVKLERGMGKPAGWMDEPHTQGKDQINEEPPPEYGVSEPEGPDDCSRYPLIAWAQAGEWSERGDRFAPYEVETYLPCPVKCSEDTFVLSVAGTSMEPKFHHGDLIFVDPEVTPVHGKYVVVRMKDSDEATFRQLLLEGNRQYLQALNPDWPDRIVELDEGATICGVVIFKGEML